jgi:hypothetical protein
MQIIGLTYYKNTLFETSLSLFLADREFVDQTFRRVLLGGSLDWSRVKPIRAAFLAAVNDMLGAAAEVGEIPEPVFQDLTCQLFMDAYIGSVHYWLADTSDGFEDTSALIDRGLDLACAQGKQVMVRFHHLRPYLRMNPEFIFLDRTRYGLLRIYEIMGARVSFRNPYEW